MVEFAPVETRKHGEHFALVKALAPGRRPQGVGGFDD